LKTNKTIYATPFKASNKETTGPSTDSGSQSLDDVVAAMGEPLKRYKRMVIYGPGEDRVVFSDFIFRIDEVGTTG
jgi:hypothetical protein